MTERTKPFLEAKADWIRGYLAFVLRQANGRTTEAARIAGMTVPNFCKYLRRWGLNAEEYR